MVPGTTDHLWTDSREPPGAEAAGQSAAVLLGGVAFKYPDDLLQLQEGLDTVRSPTWTPWSGAAVLRGGRSRPGSALTATG
ncbi:hypothetical protein Scel_00870 [Streptomyces cellostaticus]|nr:hypothetical protein Scel_00870 [Streptomyces cellostaticus]